MRVRLSVFKEYLACVLVEGRVDDAREAFPEMEEEDFDYIVANQPGGSNNKYLMWSCRQAEALLEHDPDRTALQLVVQAVRLFDGNQQRLKERDLNKYKDVSEVEAAVKELGKSKGERSREVRADSDLVYKDDRFLVIRPHTTEASCKYGVGTKWCIAATASHNYYTSYSTSNNKFYFVIDTKGKTGEPSSKFALAVRGNDVGSSEVYDASDKRVQLTTVAHHVGAAWPTMREKIEAHIKANPKTREVEEAEKAAEVHVQALLKGEKVSDQGIVKVAREGKLTMPLVKAIIKTYDGYDGPTDYRDKRREVYGALANRASELPHDAAMLLMKWIASTRTDEGGGYWNGAYSLEKLMKEAQLSAEDFGELAKTGNETVLANIMSNPNAPDEVKRSIASQVQAFRDANASQAVYWQMIRSGKITAEQFKVGVAKHPYLIDMILNPYYANEGELQLSGDLIRLLPIKNEHQLKNLLKLPNVPADFVAEVLNKLWKSIKKYDLYDILKTAPLEPRLVDQLWKDKGQDIRTALLQNPSLGADVISKFSTSKNSAYRFAVAHNTATSADDLALLSTDESVSTRSAVAANPKAPAEALTRLARDEATAVRASVASNAAAPPNILNALKKDSDEFVRKAVRKTLKALATTEALVRAMTSMSSLLREEIEDDSTVDDTMTPQWHDLPKNDVSDQQFVAIFLLQNNGSATREEVETAYDRWKPRSATTRYLRGGYGRGGRRRYGRQVVDQPQKLWSMIQSSERHTSSPTRTTSAGGKGWWWSPAGINKGALIRLTPAGAAAAMEVLERTRKLREPGGWARGTVPPVRKSPPPRELDPNAAAEPAGPRGPKTTYKIYGRFKGHPAATRLKGQAYVSGADTEFRGGEQAYITPGDDGKLKVKKVDSDHTQTWEPIDG